MLNTMRWRHYLLFIISFVLPKLIGIAYIPYFWFYNEHPLESFNIFMIVSIPIVTYLLWLSDIVFRLEKVTTQYNIRTNNITNLFLAALILAVAGLSFLTIFVIFDTNCHSDSLATGFAFILPCLMLCTLQAAHMLNIAENRRWISVEHSLPDFVLMLFFPVGVWILQPRINQLALKQLD